MNRNGAVKHELVAPKPSPWQISNITVDFNIMDYSYTVRAKEMHTETRETREGPVARLDVMKLRAEFGWERPSALQVIAAFKANPELFEKLKKP